MLPRAIGTNMPQSLCIVNGESKTVFTSSKNIKSIELINARGEIMKSISVGAKKRVTVNTAHMPSGICLARIMHTGGVETGRITIR